jgi:predicted HTH transcriptional regulator
MSLLDTVPLSSVTEAHLISLVSTGTGEALDLEFKAAPYGGSDDDKREFLKDITALANTSGGHVVIGIEDRGGTAAAVKAIMSPDADAEKLRLESLLLASVEPRLVGVQIKVELPPSNRTCGVGC